MEKYFLILGQPFSRKSVFLFLASIVLSVICLVGGYYFILLKKQAPNQAAEFSYEALDSSQQTKEADLDKAAVDSLHGILDTHLQATGMGELRDFTMQGTARDDQGQKRIVFIKGLKPNLYKFKITFLAYEGTIELGYDSIQSWIEKSWTDQPSPNEATDKQFALVLSSIAHLAWSYRSEQAEIEGIDSVLELMPMQERKGRLCHVVRSRKLLPFEMDHYIDAETFHEIYRSASIKKPDGSIHLIEMEFARWESSEGSHLPLVHTVYENGELIDELVYEPARINSILPRILFRSPKGK